MRNLLVTLALAAALPACAYDAAGVDTPAPLRADLIQRAFLDLAPDSHVAVSATDADGAPLPGVSPTVMGGRAVLRATQDGFVVIEDLKVKLADITVPPGTFSDQPIRLTDVSLHLGTQVDVDADWAPSGMSAGGTGTGDLLLDWSMVLPSGEIYQLATQKLTSRPFQLQVRLDDAGRLTAAVWMTADGTLRKFSDKVTLSDLTMAVVASRDAAAATVP